MNASAITVIVGGGIAAYRALDVVRALRRHNLAIRPVLTKGGEHFITPLSLAALSGSRVFNQLFDANADGVTSHNISHQSYQGMEHIELSRGAGAVLVVPATAHLIARMAHGIADDLATCVVLAARCPIIVAPAMNVRMWEHPATQDNINRLRSWGVTIIPPTEGAMACGEYGMGRLATVEDITRMTLQHMDQNSENLLLRPTKSLQYPSLQGKRALVTSSNTLEPIDPVRFIANRSSGRQGHAIAQALAAAGVVTTLVTGPTQCLNPDNVEVLRVDTTEQMLAACAQVATSTALDIAVFAAAPSDWKPLNLSLDKLSKRDNLEKMSLDFVATPDIIATIAGHPTARPKLVVGFSLQTDMRKDKSLSHLLQHVEEKRKSKSADWMVLNVVSADTPDPFGSSHNTVWVMTDNISHDRKSRHKGIPKEIQGDMYGDIHSDMQNNVSDLSYGEGKSMHHWKNVAKEDIAQRLVDLMSQRFVSDSLKTNSRTQ